MYLEPTLPPAEEIQNIDLQIPLRIYSSDGKLIGEFGEKRRTPISFDQVPKPFIDAVLAAEDDAFFEHNGIDIKGLVRAALQLVTTGSIKSGGSTITMQVAKNYFLTFDQLFSRKFTEILLALKLERQLSKQDIMELYINKIYLGKRAYGIQAAAQIYYGKNIDELDLAQLAMIAGLPKAPSAYNPIANPSRALERRDWILQRMHKLGFIELIDYQTAVQQPVTASLHGAVVELHAPYVAELVRSELINRYGLKVYTQGFKAYATIDSKLQDKAQQALRTGLNNYDSRHGYRGPEDSIKPIGDGKDIERWQERLRQTQTIADKHAVIVTELSDTSAQFLRRDGLKAELLWDNIKQTKRYISENRQSPDATSIDTLLAVGDLIRVEKDDADQWRLTQLPDIQGALVSIDTQSGATLAMVGGYDFKLSNFNRATQAKRQPGSNFKPFMYTYALENGFTPASLINDAPIVFKDEGLENLWRPDNASEKFYGPTPLRKALYLSRNVVSIRLMQALGVRNVANFGERFGFSDIPRNLSLALGTLTASPIEVANAYAMLANGGFSVKAYWLDRVIDGDDVVLYEAKPKIACPKCENPEEPETLDDIDALGFEELLTDNTPENPAERVVDARSVYLIDSILQDTIKRGTATKAKSLNRNDIAGKTGTTNGPTDAWFSGYNADIATTAWVGFDSYKELGRREYGGSAALPIWIDFMALALANSEDKPRARPPGIVSTLINPETGLRVKPGTPNARFEYFRDDFLPEFESTSISVDFGGLTQDSGKTTQESGLF